MLASKPNSCEPFRVRGAICSGEARKLNDSERNHTPHLDFISTTCVLEETQQKCILNKTLSRRLTPSCSSRVINRSVASAVLWFLLWAPRKTWFLILCFLSSHLSSLESSYREPERKAPSLSFPVIPGSSQLEG